MPSPNVNNKCEYKALEIFAESKEKIVALPSCKILSWKRFYNKKGRESKIAAQLLYRWRIIDDKEKRYYMRKK